MKNIYTLSFLLLFICIDGFCQNKKEQILILNSRLDSLQDKFNQNLSSFNNEQDTRSNQLNELKNQKENAHQKLRILDTQRGQFNSLNASVISDIDKLNIELSKSDRPLYCEEVDCITEEEANIFSNIGITYCNGYSPYITSSKESSPAAKGGHDDDRYKQFKNKPYTGRIKKCQNGLVILISEYKDGLLQQIDEYDLNNGEVFKTTTYTEGKNPKVNKVFPLDYHVNIQDFEIPKVYVYEKEDFVNRAISYEYLKIEKIESDLLRFTIYDANKRKISVSDERKIGEMFYEEEFSLKGIDGWVTTEIKKNQSFCLDSNKNLKVDIEYLFTDGTFNVKETIKNYEPSFCNRSKMNVVYSFKDYVWHENGPDEEFNYYISTLYEKGIGVVGRLIENEYWIAGMYDLAVRHEFILKRIISEKEFESMSPLIIELN